MKIFFLYALYILALNHAFASNTTKCNFFLIPENKGITEADEAIDRFVTAFLQAHFVGGRSGLIRQAEEIQKIAESEDLKYLITHSHPEFYFPVLLGKLETNSELRKKSVEALKKKKLDERIRLIVRLLRRGAFSQNTIIGSHLGSPQGMAIDFGYRPDFQGGYMLSKIEQEVMSLAYASNPEMNLSKLVLIENSIDEILNYSQQGIREIERKDTTAGEKEYWSEKIGSITNIGLQLIDNPTIFSTATPISPHLKSYKNLALNRKKLISNALKAEETRVLENEGTDLRPPQHPWEIIYWFAEGWKFNHKVKGADYDRILQDIKRYMTGETEITKKLLQDFTFDLYENRSFEVEPHMAFEIAAFNLSEARESFKKFKESNSEFNPKINKATPPLITDQWVEIFHTRLEAIMLSSYFFLRETAHYSLLRGRPIIPQELSSNSPENLNENTEKERSKFIHKLIIFFGNISTGMFAVLQLENHLINKKEFKEIIELMVNDSHITLRNQLENNKQHMHLDTYELILKIVERIERTDGFDNDGDKTPAEDPLVPVGASH